MKRISCIWSRWVCGYSFLRLLPKITQNNRACVCSRAEKCWTFLAASPKAVKFFHRCLVSPGIISCPPCVNIFQQIQPHHWVRVKMALCKTTSIFCYCPIEKERLENTASDHTLIRRAVWDKKPRNYWTLSIIIFSFLTWTHYSSSIGQIAQQQ